MIHQPYFVFLKGSRSWSSRPNPDLDPFVFYSPGLTQTLTVLNSSALHQLPPPSRLLFQARFTGVEGPGRESSRYITRPPSSLYSLLHRLWTSMYMRCSHFNLSQSESPRLSLLPQRTHLTWWGSWKIRRSLETEAMRNTHTHTLAHTLLRTELTLIHNKQRTCNTPGSTHCCQTHRWKSDGLYDWSCWFLETKRIIISHRRCWKPAGLSEAGSSGRLLSSSYYHAFVCRGLHFLARTNKTDCSNNWPEISSCTDT